MADVRKAFSDETSKEEFEKLYNIKKPQFDDYLIFHCHSGRRSAVAVAEVEKLGYTKYEYMDNISFFVLTPFNFPALRTMKGHGSNGQQRKSCKIRLLNKMITLLPNNYEICLHFGVISH